MRNILLAFFWLFTLSLPAQDNQPNRHQTSLSGTIDSNTTWEIKDAYMYRLAP